MPITEQTFRAILREDPEGLWELICRRLGQKPERTSIHQYSVTYASDALASQLPVERFEVLVDGVHLRSGMEHRLIPDIVVMQVDQFQPLSGRATAERFVDAPVPLVIELWSAEIDGHDLDTKIWQYQHRGDLEIWRIHPYERTLTAWRRQPDGSYTESLHTSGTIHPVALPNVTIDIARLFD